MLMRFRQSGLLWPALLTVVGLAILVSLGNWQMRRLAWKEELIARVEARAKAPPVSLSELLTTAERHNDEIDVDPLEFRRVNVSGRFLNDEEFHVWNPGKHGPAWRVVTPLELSQPAGSDSQRYPIRMALIIRGTVPAASKAVSTRHAGNPSDTVSFVGRVRVGHVGAFSNAESTAKNEWYELDIKGMQKAVAHSFVAGRAAGAAEQAQSSIAPFFIEAETPTGGAQGPQPELGNVNLFNRHLEYALTWYGLALTLVGVFVAYALQRVRRT